MRTVCSLWGGWLFTCIEGVKKHPVKVFCCFEKAYRGETSSLDISKARRELSTWKEAYVRAPPLRREDMDRFTCNWGHCWHDVKLPGHLSTLLNLSDVTSRHKAKWMKCPGTNHFSFRMKTSECWNRHQMYSDRCGSCADVSVQNIPPKSLPKSIIRVLPYHLHKMGPLSLFPPPVQGSRSIWRSGISLRSCSCCSIGVQQLPHRFLLWRELETQKYLMVRKHLRVSATFDLIFCTRKTKGFPSFFLEKLFWTFRFISNL